MTVSTELLQSLSYFSGLSPEELEALKQYVFEKSAERDDLILLEGDPAQALYFVVSGVVKIFKSSAEGKEQVLGLIRPGESFNDVPIFDGGANPASAMALGPVELYGIEKDGIDSILRQHPEVAARVIEVLAGKLRELMLLVEDLSFRHVTARLAKLLLDYTQDGGGPETAGAGVKQKLTQQEMAAMIGTAREVVGRSLKALEEEGAIRMDRHRIVITDKEALKEIGGIYS